MRRKIIYLTFTFAFSIISVFALHLITNIINHSSNGFIRLLPSHKVISKEILDIKTNSWYLVGTDFNQIYLANVTAPNRLLTVNNQLKDSVIKTITFPKNLKISTSANYTVNHSKLYLNDGMQGLIYTGNLSDLIIRKQNVTPFFTAALPNTKGSYILRSVYNNQNKLVKKIASRPDLHVDSILLQKQVDGIFCTDGDLIPVTGSDKIIYVYHFRNQIICADTNLNLIYRAKTIDTISQAQIKLRKSSDQITFAKPPLIVNKKAAANKNWIFVQSALRANNEQEETLKDLAVIDVYSIQDGKYHFSFYIPNFRHQKLQDFKVYGQKLFTIHDHFIQSWELNF